MGNRQSEATRRPPQALPPGERSAAGVGDSELLARFHARHDEWAEVAFAALVRRHGPMVLRVCRQILGDPHAAEDAFQAVFLILARKAGTIRNPELLANWLYGVALRTAREARMGYDRNRRRESPNAEWCEGEPVGREGRPELAVLGREEFEALHEEVARLPERYRIPIVLCELEGLSYKEAARRLRCPVGTISVRLSRARDRLRVRLIRRGLAPSAGLLGALVGAESASAWLPTALVESTMYAATRFATTQTTAAGLVSAPVAALTEAVLKAMAVSRAKVAVKLVLALGMTATVGWVGAPREPRVPTLAPIGDSRPAAVAGTGVIPPSEGRPTRPPVQAPTKAEKPAPEPTTTPTVADRPASSPAKAVAAEAELVRKTSDVVKELGGDFHTKRMTPEANVTLTAGERALRDEWAQGEALFAKEWVPDDPMGHGGDGLGPVYNETSCMACHGLGGPGGAGPAGKNVVLVSATPTGRIQVKGLELIHPGFRGTRSIVLHRFGTDSRYESWRTRFYQSQRELGPDTPSDSNTTEATPEELAKARILAIKTQTRPDHRHQRQFARLQPTKDFTFALSERNPPALFGAGRIDAIPAKVLIAAAEQQPKEVRGRINRTRDGEIGRFGWKSQISSLHEFVRAACANELGLEVPGHSQAISPIAPDAKAKGLDLLEPECDAMVAYVRALPAPVVVDPTGPRGTDDMRQGRRLFAEVGCASCHSPTLGEVRGIYSDLLLHDMGPSLSDSGSYYGNEGPYTPGGPRPNEWRTPPLWGYRDSGPYLHDGRAQTLEETIALHEGQAQASAIQFFARSPREQLQIEAFLKSLVAPSAASTPGVMLAAELESYLEKDRRPSPEAITRRDREAAVVREQERWQEARRRRFAEEAASRARTQFPVAQNLEKMGKIAGALNFYREIARNAPDSEPGRQATARISELTGSRQ